mmetsp:Transcript_5327/g.16763  ORF Transcript_5327/g.16763 Transcript_5327/m.16763 type:complete len:161 (+) Transcript_5327:267-749(+)
MKEEPTQARWLATKAEKRGKPEAKATAGRPSWKSPGKKAQRGQAKQTADSDSDEAYEVFRSIIDAPKVGRPKFSAEEYARHAAIAREYNVKSRKAHDAFHGQLALKIDLQQFAVRSLPPHMEAHAAQCDDLPLPPLDRRWWTYTPPIPGFKPEDHVIEDD